MFWLLIFQLLNETKTSTSLYKLKAPKLVAKIHQCNHFRME
jgi:hypothetical protein